MPDAEITIERSPEIVWSYFTEPGNWEKWEDGVLKAAQWRKGGKLEWEGGGSSSISVFTSGKIVKIDERWKSTAYTFEPDGIGNTIVGIQSTPSEEVDYSDGGAAESSRLISCLDNLKKCIESETEGNIAQNLTSDEERPKASPIKKWWEFWK